MKQKYLIEEDKKESEQSTCPELDSLSVLSTQRELYKKFFQKIKGVNRQILMNMLAQSNIKMYEDSLKIIQRNFSITSIKSTSHSSIYQFSVSLYPFYTNLLILFQEQKSILENCQIYAFGSCGNIYLAYNQQKQQPFVIKQIFLENMGNWNIVFLNSLKQYMLNLIMSTFKIGPTIKKHLGFDLIVFPEAIVFAMEYCPNKKINQRLQNDLKQNLVILHHFNIVHLDIKPTNVAFSRQFNKWIFIDFGFTQIINQNIGYKTKTRYIGTFSYSSTQMKNCLQKADYVDLYYNDVYSLEQTIFNIKSCQLNQEFILHYSIEQIQNQFEMGIVQFQKKTIIKYYMLTSQLDLTQKFITKFNLRQRVQEIIKFMMESFPSASLKNFYYQYVFDKIQDDNIKKMLDSKFKTHLKLTSNSNQKTFSSDNFDSFDISFLKNKLNFIKITEDLKQVHTKAKLKKIRNWLLMDQKFIQSTQEDFYIQLLYKYITFQQNQFKAELKNKNQVASFFIRRKNVNQLNYLGYYIETQELLTLVVCIKLILQYCQTEPFSQIKNSLYPLACAEFVLVNPCIFTKKHQINYLKTWTHMIFKQNNKSLYKMLLRLLKVFAGFKYIQYQNREIYFQDMHISNIFQALSDIQNIDCYLLNQLKSENSVQELKKMLKSMGQISIEHQTYDKTSFLQAQLIDNQSFDKHQKYQFLAKLRMGRCFDSIWKSKQKCYINRTIEQLYSNLNLSFISEQLLHLCLCYQKVHDIFNCRQIIDKIDNVINCKLISDRYLFMSRMYVDFFRGNKQEIISYFQVQVNNAKEYQSLKSYFYCTLVQFSNFLMQLKVQKKSRNQIQLQKNQKINKKIILLNDRVVQKITKCIEKIVSKIKKQEKSQMKLYQLHHQLFGLLKTCMKFLDISICRKQYFFRIFQQMYQQMRISLQEKPYQRKNQMQNLKIVAICIQHYERLRFQQLIIFLQKYFIQIKIQQLSIMNQQNFYLFQLFAIYVKVYHQLNNKNTDNSRRCYSYLSTSPCSQIKLNQLYGYVIKKLFKYLTNSQQFILTLQYDSPNFQILDYLYNQKLFKKFFTFLYTFTKYVGSCPNSVNIYQLTFNLCTFRRQNQILSFQFIKYFEHVQYNNKKVWVSPYWFLATSIICSWIQKCNKKTLVLISKSINYMIFYGKKQCLKKIYFNATLYQAKKKLSFSKKGLINQSRKTIYYLKKHLKYYIQRKLKIEQLQAVKFPKIICESVKKRIIEKITNYHTNIGNI